MAAASKIHPGEIPSFWDRSVVFFANLLSIFYGNIGETSRLREEVGGLETYGGRLVPIINILFRGADNLLVLEESPNMELLEYFTDNLKLSLPDFEILPHDDYIAFKEQCPDRGEWDDIWERIAERKAAWVDGFVTDPTLCAVADMLGKQTISALAGSRTGNNKYMLHQHMEAQGYPVFDTEMAVSAESIGTCLQALRARGYAEAVIKSQVGASGIGMLRTRTDDDVAVPPYFFFEGPCMVQGWISDGMDGAGSVSSPSVQMFLDEEDVHLYDLTDQILSDDSIHQGNLAPPLAIEDDAATRTMLLDQAASAGAWLHAQGYRGTASADFLVVTYPSEKRVFMCEINARVTGATYPSVLARHFLPNGAWLMRNMSFRTSLHSEEILGKLEEAGHLYQPGKARGIIPINFNQDRFEHIYKGQFLFLGGKPDECLEEMDRAEVVLPTEVDYDRD